MFLSYLFEKCDLEAKTNHNIGVIWFSCMIPLFPVSYFFLLLENLFLLMGYYHRWARFFQGERGDIWLLFRVWWSGQICCFCQARERKEGNKAAFSFLLGLKFPIFDELFLHILSSIILWGVYTLRSYFMGFVCSSWALYFCGILVSFWSGKCEGIGHPKLEEPFWMCWESGAIWDKSEKIECYL